MWKLSTNLQIAEAEEGLPVLPESLIAIVFQMKHVALTDAARTRRSFAVVIATAALVALWRKGSFAATALVAPWKMGKFAAAALVAPPKITRLAAGRNALFYLGARNA